LSYLIDTNAVEVYDGSSWVSIGSSGDITGVTAGTGITGGGTSGTVTITNDMATTITAAGDIVVGTGNATYDNLPIGTTGQVLTADTTVSPYKVKWAAAAGGANWTLVNAGGTALTGAQTVTVSGISGADKIMVIVDSASSANVQSNIGIRLNTQTGTIYYRWGQSIIAGSTYAASNFETVSQNDTSIRIGTMSNSASSVVRGSATFTGCNSSGVKQFIAVGGAEAASSNSMYFYSTQGYVNLSATVSSVSIFSSTGNLDSGTVYVYTSA
jgi:hypothetical protein